MKFLLTIGLMLLVNLAQAAPLILETEAKLPAPSAVKFRAISRGPSITIESPDLEAETVKSPFNFKVLFKPHGGAAVNLKSIKITYLRIPAINLLERLNSSISEQGIDFSNAEVPVGVHNIEISLEDSDGRVSIKVITLNVSK